MKNLRLTFRMLKRNSLLLYIGIPGLAIGLCAVLLLTVYLKHEFDFDKHFLTRDRVLRLGNVLYEQDKTSMLPISLRTDYTELPGQVSEVEKSVQLYQEEETTVKTDNGTFGNLKTLYTDPEFFNVFGIKLYQGNTADALTGKNNIVVTRATAMKIFGTLNCIGKIIAMENRQMVVTGVMNDIPSTTHFSADILLPMQSNEFIIKQGSLEFYTYYLIYKGADIDKAKQNIAAVNDKLMEVWKTRGSLNDIKTGTYTDMLGDIHLYTKSDFDMVPKANLMQLVTVGGIAVFILLIALINFINMYLMYGERRISEITSRKIAGASRGEITLLLYRENGLIAVIALFLGLSFAALTLPYFSGMIKIPLKMNDLFTPTGIGLILMILVFLILISGSYPGIILSKTNLISGLKGKHHRITHGRFSRSVVMVQFFLTVLLVCSMLIIRAQITYLKDVPLGFRVGNVTLASDFSDQTAKNAENIKQALEKMTFIQNVGLSDHSMGGGCSGQSISLLNNEPEKPVNEYRVFPGFCETMQFQLLQGRFFSDDPADKNSIILNKAAVNMLGLKFKEGMHVIYKGEPVEVKGIINDFYSDGYAGKPIEPIVISRARGWAWNFYLRTGESLTVADKQKIASVFRGFNPETSVTFTPLTDIYNAKFEKDERVYRMVSYGTFLAIILSFVGMLSLSLMNVTRRVKEIGIRKVMGSSEIEILNKLLGEIFFLVIIASCMASATSYFLMTEWLSNFAKRVDLSVWYFLMSISIAVLLALLSVALQCWKAATRNPVEALRYE
jgi:putative ABC transport system permease protein